MRRSGWPDRTGPDPVLKEKMLNFSRVKNRVAGTIILLGLLLFRPTSGKKPDKTGPDIRSVPSPTIVEQLLKKLNSSSTSGAGLGAKSGSQSHPRSSSYCKFS
jgi:hypothetical protein